MRARVSELEGGSGGLAPPGHRLELCRHEGGGHKQYAWAAESFPVLVQLENSGGEALPGAKSAVRKA